ncbi:MAG: low temperature requirement protein A [Gaiellaceae bacterium]
MTSPRRTGRRRARSAPSSSRSASQCSYTPSGASRSRVSALRRRWPAAALWWAYFDVVSIVAERKLREAEGRAQLAMARDSYSYLHLPMVAGIAFFAVGMKKTLADVGEPLHTVPAVTLCGGIALYLLAHVLFRLRNVRTLSRRRLLVSVVLVALVPAAVELPALATLAVVAAILAGLITYEAIRYAEARERVRRATA